MESCIKQTQVGIMYRQQYIGMNHTINYIITHFKCSIKLYLCPFYRAR